MDFYGVEEHFGDLAKLRELVERRPPPRAEGHPGPGRQPHRPLPPLGRRTRPRPPGSTARRRTTSRTPGRPGRSPTPRQPAVQQGHARTAGSSTSCPTSTRTIPEVGALHDPEHAVVDGHDRARRDPPGHAALRAAPLLARLDGRDQARVSAGSRSSASCSTATLRWWPSSRAGAPASTASTRASTRSSTSRSTTPLRRAFGEGRPLREVAVMLGRDHLYVDASQAGHLPRTPRRAAVHERAGRDAGGPAARVHHAAHRARHPLVYYGDEIALPGGGRSRQPARFPGRLAAGPAQRLRALGPKPRGAGGVRARAAAGAPARGASAAPARPDGQPRGRRAGLGLRARAGGTGSACGF